MGTRVQYSRRFIDKLNLYHIRILSNLACEIDNWNGQMKNSTANLCSYLLMR